MRFALIAIAFLLSSAAVAGEIHPLYRGTRQMAMGGAYSAIADDEQAVFLNPAGMAGNTGSKFHLLLGDVSASTSFYTLYKDASDAFKNISTNSLNVLLGKNLYVQATASPTLTFPGFGIAFLSDHQYFLRVENRALPKTTLGIQDTNGVQAAYGTTLTRKGARTKGELRVGVALKLMYRRGGYRKLPLTTMLDLSKSSLGPIIGNYQRGFGGDFGSQYIRKVSNRFQWSTALTYLDIGDTTFSDGPDPQKGNLGVGLGAQLDMGTAKIITAYDYKNIMDETDPRKKSHFGMEFKLPIFSFNVGLNQMFLTYGAGVDLWLINIRAASYGEEIGSYANQNPDRRYMMRVGFVLHI